MMTPERWQHVQDLFHQALDRDPEKRAAFLDNACDDPALRAEVEALLDADAAPPSLFDTAQELTQTLHTADQAQPSSPRHDRLAAPSGLGRRIGPYRLLHEIGRGGMGTVYLAQRDDLDKRVALKLVRGGLAAPETVERFLRERRLLARLEHPHIARLLDAGMTGEGTPYFVMEHVEGGRAITAYCDQKKLTITQRLALFQRVCQAVHYAHQNLIIHRDLKPPNILVTDAGQVKLMDFGIAKLMEDEDEAEGLTRTGMRLMTPEYAAPEQVRGEAVTTATDVYALGVLLYELLTGHRPYEVGGRSLGEIERVICEQEPVKPSVAARRYPVLDARGDARVVVSSEPIRAVRRRNAERLSRRLAGDLDVICLKALSKEVSRRYASAEQLAADLERHLLGLPVEARARTMGYRARKFVRRHRVSVGATGAVMLLVAVLVGVFTLHLARERDRAQVEAAKAAQVSSFMMGLFEASDPGEALGEQVTAQALLERGLKRAEALSGEPEVQAQMLSVMGQVYESLGEYEEAGPLLERALAVRRQVLGEEHPDVAASLNNLAYLLDSRGDYDAAEPRYREALRLRRALLGNAVEVAESLNDLAGLLRRKGDYGEAARLAHEALAIYRDLLGEEHALVAESLNNLALVSKEQGDYKAAEALFRKALALNRKLFGEVHPDVAVNLNNLASLLRRKGDYEAAEPFAREALTMRRKLYGEAHPRVAFSLQSLASLLHDKGDLATAESLYREVLAMRRDLLGADHPRVAESLDGLALLRSQQGAHAEAETLMRESLAMRRRLLGPEHPAIAFSLNNLAVVLRRMGDYDEAETLIRASLAIRRDLLGARHPAVARASQNLASLLVERGRYQNAEPIYQEALSIYIEQFGEGSRRVQEVYEGFAELYEAWGKPDQAAVYHERLRETETEQ